MPPLAYLAHHILTELLDGLEGVRKTVTGHTDLHCGDPELRESAHLGQVGIGVEPGGPGSTTKAVEGDVDRRDVPLRAVTSAP